MRARYLTFFSYIGTPFRSSEKIWLKTGRNHPDPESVQGMLELALLRLRSLNYPNVVLSSRTDGGVHALNTSAHFDLERYGSNIYEPNAIVLALNKFFFKSDSSIHVRQCIRVSDTFHARFKAKGRTYLYRLAVLKRNEISDEDYNGIAQYMPIEEWKRCHFVRAPDFDIERLKAGAQHLVGYHDFTTFRKADKLLQYKHNRRELQSIEIRPGKPLVTPYSNQGDLFDYWDIEFKGRAFVHNQIRRMMGTLISVAIGKLAPEDVKVMLQIPSKHSWYNFIQNGPPDGLYLCNVEYDPQDLIYDPNAGTDPSKTEEKIKECEVESYDE